MNKRYKYDLILCNHWSFIGIGWQLGVESCRNSIEQSLACYDINPHIKVCINLDARAYEKVKEYYPETIIKLEKYLKEGKTELIGGTYGQPMGSMIGNESIIRQILYGKKSIKDTINYDVVAFLEEEEFTFPQLPQILKKAGIRYASLAQCDTWGKVGVPTLDKSIIKWEAKDGSYVFAAPKTILYFHPPVVTKDVNSLIEDEGRKKLEDASKKNNHPLVVAWTEFGWEPPEEHNINAFYQENYQKLKDVDDVSFVTLSEYLKKYSSESLDSILLTYDDFNKLLPWGVGSDNLRKYDRVAEANLLTLEKLNSLFGGYNIEFDKKINSLWKELLMSESHDVTLCEFSRWGGGVMPPEERAEYFHGMQWGAIGYRYVDNVLRTTESLLKEEIDNIAKNTKTFKDDYILSLVIFNPRDHEISEVFKTPRIYFKNKGITDFKVVNEEGALIDSIIFDQHLNDDGSYFYVRLLLNVHNLKEYSLNKYYIVSGKAKNNEEKLLKETVDNYVLKNDNIQVIISKKTGRPISLMNNKVKEETITDSFLNFYGKPNPNYLVLDNNRNYDISTLTPSFKILYNSDLYAKIAVEFNDVRLSYVLNYSINKLSKGLDVKVRLKIHTPPEQAKGNINGWQLPLEIQDGYWLDLGLKINNPKYYLDAPFEICETKKDKIHARTFLDVKGDNNSLQIIHSGNQYFKIVDGKLNNLLLREWESHFTGLVDWIHYNEYSYRFIPSDSKETLKECLNNVSDFDYKLLLSTIESNGDSYLINNLNFVSKNTIISSLKRIGDYIEMRLINYSEKVDLISVSSNLISKAFLSDLNDSIIEEISVKDNKIEYSMNPFEISTILIK